MRQFAVKNFSKHRITSAIILSLVFVFSISSMVPTNFASAQVPGLGGIGNKVPVNDSTAIDNQKEILKGINGKTVGPLGAAVAVVGVITRVKNKLGGAAAQTCLNTVNAISSASNSTILASLSATNTGLIGGAGVVAGIQTTNAEAIGKARDCVHLYVDLLKNEPAANLQEASDLQRELVTYSEIESALSKRYDDMTAQAKAGWQEILRAFMVKTILNINKTLTTELVNKMITKYKISDYQAYGDALASQVYSMKYINDNYAGNTEKQLMVRSILQSPKIPGKANTVQAMATSQAQNYIGQACQVNNPNANQNDPMYFINCMAALGSPGASGNWRVMEGVDAANAASGAGKVLAAQEISQSNGYAPPRNCSGSLAQQQQIDSQLDSATLALKNAQDIKQRLVNAQADPAEIAKAQKDLDQAIANYDSFKSKFDAGGGQASSIDPTTGELIKAKPGAIIDICEAIASPASFVSSSLGDFLKQHLDQTSQLKSDNLPFYLNFLSDVTSNFLTNMLTGNKNKTQVLKEAGVGALNGTLIGIAQTAGNTNSGNGTTPPTPATGEVRIYARLASSTNQTTSLSAGQAYVLVINFRDLIATPSNNKDPLLNPYRAVITGLPDASSSNVILDPADIAAGNVAFDYTPTTVGPFLLKVQMFAAGTQSNPGDVPLNSGGGWTQQFTVSAVRGVATTIPFTGFMPRGPVSALR